MSVLISRNEYKIEVKSFHPKMVYRRSGNFRPYAERRKLNAPKKIKMRIRATLQNRQVMKYF